MTYDVTTDTQRAYRGIEELAALTEHVARHAPVGGDQRAFLVGWGLLAAMQRQALAVILLHRKGFGHEAAPNRRAMIEHLAQIRWLSEDGCVAVDSMNRALQFSQQRLRDAADAAGMQYDPSIADAVKATVIPAHPANQYNNFSPLLQRLNPVLWAMWRGETQLAHPTLTAAQFFYDDRSEATATLFSEPTRRDGTEDPADRCPYIAFLLLWSAFDGFNRLLKGEPWKEDLQRIASDGGIEEL
ncbi:hypothetical protein [Streptomyces sp. ISID311]|uniref:hypothetical protein n=1 Tax=Streptomyces sp. ISID311 TaxID=2601673 RepID=UPI0011BD3C35|nr:hypothetical protein [Streptomyces sp. ISID311]TXC99031.1 hypothetical protein FS847_06515 [Streptomyces sp. ISID311]